MAQEAHEAPVGRGRDRSSSSTSPATGMWESPRQMQTHTPFPYRIVPCAAGAGLAAAADSGLQPSSEHGPGHAWNQSAPSMGAHAHGSSGYIGNFLSLLEAKSVTPEMFEDVVPAACDYLGGVGTAAGPSDMAYVLGGVDHRYSVAGSSAPPVQHETTASSPLGYSGVDGVVHGGSMGCMPCHDEYEVKPDRDTQRHGLGVGAPTAAFLQQLIPSRVELQSALGCSGMVSERLESSFGVGSLPDAGSFCDYNRPSAEFMSSNRHKQDTRPGMGSSSSGSGAATSVATRRKSEEGVGGNTKKSKQEASRKASSPPKPQVKLGEKITALQQIVSPFGKTDTSSVLFETIEYIKFLHEQIRLFSEPYMTKNTYKGHIRFRGEEKKEESGTGLDLRGRGLCLAPVSLTSQAYHDDTVPDCWAPAYRSCLFR